MDNKEKVWWCTCVIVYSLAAFILTMDILEHRGASSHESPNAAHRAQ